MKLINNLVFFTSCFIHHCIIFSFLFQNSRNTLRKMVKIILITSSKLTTIKINTRVLLYETQMLFFFVDINFVIYRLYIYILFYCSHHVI